MNEPPNNVVALRVPRRFERIECVGYYEFQGFLYLGSCRKPSALRRWTTRVLLGGRWNDGKKVRPVYDHGNIVVGWGLEYPHD